MTHSPPESAPSSDDVASRPSKGFVTFYYHQFAFGLTFPIHSFFIHVCRCYGVPVNQLNPNAIKYIVCFYVVCISASVDHVPELFAQILYS